MPKFPSRARRPLALAALILGVSVTPAWAWQATSTSPARHAEGPEQGFSTRYVRLAAQDTEGLLYEPVRPGPNTRIALVYTHPNANTFNEPLGREMAARGYRVLMVNHRGDTAPEAYLPSVSRGVSFARSLPGVTRVIVVGHSGGGPLVALYENVAEHGPTACGGPEKIYPCKPEGLESLAKPDGLILLDSTLGAFHQMSAVDPAVDGDKRIAALDMFAPANGYDLATRRARYTAAFAQRFYRAQADRNARIVAEAQARLGLIAAGAGPLHGRRAAGRSGPRPERRRRQAVPARRRVRGAHQGGAHPVAGRRSAAPAGHRLGPTAQRAADGGRPGLAEPDDPEHHRAPVPGRLGDPHARPTTRSPPTTSSASTGARP
jgi:hypothetical protein